MQKSYKYAHFMAQVIESSQRQGLGSGQRSEAMAEELGLFQYLFIFNNSQNYILKTFVILCINLTLSGKS